MGRRFRVAIIMNRLVDVKHHHEMFAGTQRWAAEHSWECVVWPQQPDDRVLRGSGGKDRGYDGILGQLSSGPRGRGGRGKIPAVNVWIGSLARGVPLVGVDQKASGRLAAEHLRERGFTRIGYLGFSRVRSSSWMADGVREVAGSDSRDFTQLLVPQEYYRSVASWSRFQQKLSNWVRSWRTPIGVVTADDVTARYLADRAKQFGMRVPGDVAIVGMANEPGACLHPEPALTSMEFGFSRVGYQAAELLHRLMTGQKPPEEPILVPPVGLVVRDSTDAFAFEDPVVAAALRFMADDADRAATVPEVVARVPLSRRALERRFQEVLGRTIAEELLRFRLERAKRWLAETDMSVKKVARRCGFTTSQRFSQVFRRVEGLSPSAYRRRYTSVAAVPLVGVE